jgi:curved DNA-binding protein CbpA
MPIILVLSPHARHDGSAGEKMVASAVDPKNPFLILQLPSNATPAEIKRAAQLALTRARLEGAETEQGQARLRRIEEAIERLRDPVERIRAGLEWPSLSAAGAAVLRDNPSFANLAETADQERSAEIEVLLAQESLTDRVHARAIFSFLRAKALLGKHAQAYPGGSQSAEWLELGRRMLRSGLIDWNSAMSTREFWIEQRLRAKELGDPRVDSAFVQQLESESTAIPLDRFAEIASDALRVRNAKSCKSIVEALREAPSPQPLIDAALGTVYEPVCARITPALAAFQKAVKDENSKDASAYRSLLQRYQAEIGIDVALFLEIGDLPGSSEERIRDEAAKALKQLAVAAANNADAYDVSSLILDEAKRAVAGSALSASVTQDQATVRRLAVQSERARKTAPHAERFQVALARGDLETAVTAIDQLIQAVPAEEAQELRAMRRRIASSFATELFNRAVAHVKTRDFDMAIELLTRARQYETAPSELRIIEDALVKTRMLEAQSSRTPFGGVASVPSYREKQGCLIPLVFAALTLLGGVGGVVAALGVAMQAAQAQLSPSMMEGN